MFGRIFERALWSCTARRHAADRTAGAEVCEEAEFGCPKRPDGPKTEAFRGPTCSARSAAGDGDESLAWSLSDATVARPTSPERPTPPNATYSDKCFRGESAGVGRQAKRKIHAQKSTWEKSGALRQVAYESVHLREFVSDPGPSEQNLVLQREMVRPSETLPPQLDQTPSRCSGPCRLDRGSSNSAG